MRHAVAITLLAGCGRIHFDPTGSDPDGGSSGRCTADVPFTSITELAELRSSSSEGGLRLTDDELTAYFHSDRMGGTNLIYVATRASRADMFGTPTLAFNAPSALWPTVSGDGLTLLYNSASPAADLYVTTRASKTDMFPTGTAVGALDTASREASPMLARSGTTLYFTRYVPAVGTIEVASWPGPTASQTISELAFGDIIYGATLSADERTIYFARGVAETTIYVAQRATTTTAFGPAVLVAELESSAADNPTWLSTDQCRLYFESDRSGFSRVYVAERGQ